jgi:hypothetical protein
MKITNKTPGDLGRGASNTGEAEHCRDETYNEKRYRPTEHDRVLLSAQ